MRVDVLDQYKEKPAVPTARHGGIGRVLEVSLTCRLCVVLTGGLLEASPTLWRGAFTTRGGDAEILLSSPGKAALLVCERQGQ